ncbi:hypothetical protein SAMN04488066_10529 [Halorubrum aquaticum]|uniref:Uncharacterized protein n=1 Tax=Halorubrum aquaticum TaxID=387340 RepID=A0A1I3AB23_9EURY|nr:hypothetical protein SAMN04488066_10529 [Halorubrum aquaticum]
MSEYFTYETGASDVLASDRPVTTNSGASAFDDENRTEVAR